MALEREELAKKPADRGADRTQLAGLAQAALKADAVTGDAAWDTYCSYIQRAIEVAKQQRGETLALLGSTSLVGDLNVAQARNLVFQLDERIRSLEWAITMPAEIKKVGSIAKERLKAMDIEDGESESATAA
jgi:hypothetical protein